MTEISGHDFTDGTITLIVLCTLFVFSTLLNDHINRQNPRELFDGQTAMWVILGCGYTIVGFALIMSVWYDAGIGLIAMFILFGCFAASGIPMYFGDVSRARRSRRDQDAERQREKDREEDRKMYNMGRDSK